jgi:hypothetical protein
VLDSLELYEPFHLQCFQQPFSFIDSKIIDSIDFFGGGYTADLGDRHGGFVRMETSATQDPNRARIEVGTINTRLSYGAPWSKGSWLASARAWYPQEMGNTIEIGEEGVEPRFEDLYLKGSFNLSPNVVLSAHMLAAQDRLDFNSPDDAESVDSANRTSHVWLRMLGSWSPRLASETVVSAGRMDRSRKGFSEADVSDTEKALVEVADRRSVNFTGVKQDMTWEIADAHLLRAGVDLRWLEADYRYDTHATSGEFPTMSTSLDPTGTSFGAFTTYRTLLGPSLVVEAGLRWDRQSYTDDSQISPRLNTVWRLGQRSELRFAVGRFSQSQRIHELRVEDGETEFQPAETSRQVDVTFQHELPGGLRLRIDAYDWRITDVQSRAENLFNPLELFPETERDRVILSPTSARLSGRAACPGAQDKPFYWWASGTWSSAVDTIDGHDEPRSWDQRSPPSFLVGYHAADRWSPSRHRAYRMADDPGDGHAYDSPDGTVEIERAVGERSSERFPGASASTRSSAARSPSGGGTAPRRRGPQRHQPEERLLRRRDGACRASERVARRRNDVRLLAPGITVREHSLGVLRTRHESFPRRASLPRSGSRGAEIGARSDCAGRKALRRAGSALPMPERPSSAHARTSSGSKRTETAGRPSEASSTASHASRKPA